MSQVSVTIDGKIYRMACDEGQEEHLIDLAGRFDRYVGHLKGSFGEIGDQRLTVMAGIMVIDELAELQKRFAQLEGEVGTLTEARDEAVSSSNRGEAALGAALSSLADRIERVAAQMAIEPAPA